MSFITRETTDSATPSRIAISFCAPTGNLSFLAYLAMLINSCRQSSVTAPTLDSSKYGGFAQEGVFLTEKKWPPPEGFGDKVRRLARDLGLSNPAIAKELSVHEVTVSRIFAGQVPRGAVLIKLARLLKVSPDWLLEQELGDLEDIADTDGPLLSPSPESTRRVGGKLLTDDDGAKKKRRGA